MNPDSITALITDSGHWRREWRNHDPEVLLTALTALDTPLARTRAAFVLAHLGHFEAAEAVLGDLGSPLATGVRAAMTLNRAVGAQDMTRIDALCSAPEFVGAGEHTFEGQLLLDLARGQAWLERGDAVQAGDLLRSALRLSKMLEAPTAFIESQLARLIREPMAQVRELGGHLDRAVRAGDLRTIASVASDLGYAALNCLDLASLTRATRYMPRGPLRDEYVGVAEYLRGHRGLSVPRGAHPTTRLAQHLADLETALVAQWGFEQERWPALAEALTALGNPVDPEAAMKTHAVHLIRARAWIILSDWDSAARELAHTSRYRRLSLLSALTGLEGALLLGRVRPEPWVAQVAQHVSVLPPDMLRWTIHFAARVCPAAVAYCAGLWDEPWESTCRARVHVITPALQNAGKRHHSRPDDLRRVTALREYLQGHPERSVAPHSALHAPSAPH